LQVERGQPLLAALRERDVFLASACGGRGLCGLCRLKVLHGGGPPQPAERRHLSAEEIAAGVRLGCQVRAEAGLAVEIPPKLLASRRYQGAVERIRDLTHDIKEVRIRLVEPDAIDFVPGQYVQLEAPPPSDDAEGAWRAYSIASPPADREHVELIIRLVPGGLCTTWVFRRLREGEAVRLRGPFGEFRLADTDRPMVWLAGGSGMAPFRSLLHHLRKKGAARPCTFFFGAVALRDLFYLEEFHAAERRLPWFCFVPALSDPAEGDRWEGETGLITEVADRRLRDAGDAEAYLCGSAALVNAARKVLRRKGVPPERIYYDKYN